MASHGRRGQDSPAPLPAVHRRLAQPRPPLERALNQYVETPLRAAPLPPHPHPPGPGLKPDTRPCRDANFALVTLPVTAAPGKTSGIVCSECNRCRCASCRTPRPLPSKLLCGTSCLCSPESVLDCVTCMCLPKAFSYHCTDEEDSSRPGPGWPSLALFTLLCPCLLCYLPCKGLLRLCEACHRLSTTPGCRCTKLYSPPAPQPMEKRLLDSPE